MTRMKEGNDSNNRSKQAGIVDTDLPILDPAPADAWPDG